MPSVTAAQLVAEVKVEGDEQAKQKLESVSGKVKETREGFTGMLKGALSFAAGQAVFMGVGDAIRFMHDQIADVIKVTIDHQQVAAQTNQVLKSTKDVSGQTAQSLDDLAAAFSRTTMFSADTVQGGENLLLTFTNIGKSVFPQATQSILDVSQAMGQDLKSSAIQVGKALGDPLTGMTALQRIGVTFSAQEKDAIKTMMSHNDIIGAQKVILKELSTEFGGSAVAAGKTFGGQMAIVNNTLEDMKIKIGTALLPILGHLLNDYIQPLIGKFSDWMFKQGGLNDIQSIIRQIADYMTTTFLPALGNLLNVYIIPLANQFYDLFIKSGWVHDAFQKVSDITGQLVPIVFGLATNIGNVVGWFQKAGPQGDILKAALMGVGTAIGLMKITDMIGSFMTFATQTIPEVLVKLGILTGTNGLGSVGPAAQAAAGVNGIGAIGPAATEAAGVVETESAAMKLSLGGVMGIIIALDLAAKNLTDQIGQTKIPGTNTTLNQWQQIMQKSGSYGGGIPFGPQYTNPPLRSTTNPDGTGDINPLPIHSGNVPTTTRGRGFASGGPVTQSGWYNFMEKGPEGVAYLPQGAQVIPNNQLSGGGSTPTVLNIHIAGHQVAQVLLPEMVQAIRSAVGSVGF